MIVHLVACIEGFDDGEVSAKPEERSAGQGRVGYGRTGHISSAREIHLVHAKTSACVQHINLLEPYQSYTD